MGALKIDDISARTLPALDKVFLSGDLDRMTDILAQTKGEPLKRLALAAVSRHKFIGGALSPSAGSREPLLEAQLLEEFINFNLTSFDDKYAVDAITEALEQVGDTGMQLILTLSVIRYNSYDNAA